MKRPFFLTLVIITVMCIITINSVDASTHISQLTIHTYLDGVHVSSNSDDPHIHEVDDGEDHVYLLDVHTYRFYVTGDNGQAHLDFVYHLYFYYKNGELYKVEVW